MCYKGEHTRLITHRTAGAPNSTPPIGKLPNNSLIGMIAAINPIKELLKMKRDRTRGLKKKEPPKIYLIIYIIFIYISIYVKIFICYEAYISICIYIYILILI
jgi:hypothetical protein